MPAKKSSLPASEGAPEGRVNQRLRTRRALIDAALSLREKGVNPTLADVAKHALISRATAYRYFQSVEALLSETATDRGMTPLEQFWQPGDDAVEGIGRAAIELHKLLLADEVGLHVMERSFMSVWLESAPGDAPARPGRRTLYIGPLVDSLKDRLTPSARKRLKLALTTVMGTEPLIAARDVGGGSINETLEATSWAARSLVRQALADAEAARKKQ